MQPGLGQPQLPSNGVDRKARTLGNLLRRHAGKEMHFQQVRLELVDRREPAKGLIERHDAEWPFRCKRDGFGKLALGGSAAFFSLALPGMIHQYLPHDTCRNTIEMRPVGTVRL